MCIDSIDTPTSVKTTKNALNKNENSDPEKNPKIPTDFGALDKIPTEKSPPT